MSVWLLTDGHQSSCAMKVNVVFSDMTCSQSSSENKRHVIIPFSPYYEDENEMYCTGKWKEKHDITSLMWCD